MVRASWKPTENLTHKCILLGFLFFFFFLIGCQHLEFRQFYLKDLLKNQKTLPDLAHVAQIAGAGLELPLC